PGIFQSMPATSKPQARRVTAETPLLAKGRSSFGCTSGVLLWGLSGDNTGRSGFLGFGLLGSHGLVDPVVGSLQIGLTGFRVFALVFGALAIQQVQIGHGIVVVGAKLQRLLQVLNTVFDLLLVLRPEVGAGFLVLELVRWLHTEAGAGGLGGLVGLHPVDDRQRVVALRIFGVEVSHLLVILRGLVELLHAEVQRGNAFQAVDLLFFGWIERQYLLESVDGLFGEAVVIGRIGAGNVLLGVGGG